MKNIIEGGVNGRLVRQVQNNELSQEEEKCTQKQRPSSYRNERQPLHTKNIVDVNP